MNGLLPDELPYRWGIFLNIPPVREKDEPRWRLVACGRAHDRRRALRDVLAVCEARNLKPRDSATRCEIQGPMKGCWHVCKRINVTTKADDDSREFGQWHLESLHTVSY